MSQLEDEIQSKKIAADIVIAFLGQNSVAAEDLPRLVSRVLGALGGPTVATPRVAEVEAAAPRPGGPPAAGDAAEERPVPRVPIGQSVQWDYLISLEDGKQYRSLRRHLMAKYGMTPEDYRRKWGLPDDYPMVAPSYAQDRSEVAKRIGLGKRKPKSAKGRPSARS